MFERPIPISTQIKTLSGSQPIPGSQKGKIAQNFDDMTSRLPRLTHTHIHLYRGAIYKGTKSHRYSIHKNDASPSSRWLNDDESDAIFFNNYNDSRDVVVTGMTYNNQKCKHSGRVLGTQNRGHTKVLHSSQTKEHTLVPLEISSLNPLHQRKKEYSCHN